MAQGIACLGPFFFSRKISRNCKARSARKFSGTQNYTPYKLLPSFTTSSLTPRKRLQTVIFRTIQKFCIF